MPFEYDALRMNVIKALTGLTGFTEIFIYYILDHPVCPVKKENPILSRYEIKKLKYIV